MMRRALLIALLALPCTGCLSIRPLPAGDPKLAANEGILVIHLHTKVPIEKLAISGTTALSDVSPGDHLVLLAVSAGQHRWSEIAVSAGEGHVRFRPHPDHDEDWEFRVEPGRLNYPGEMSFYGKSREDAAELGAILRNRSALVLAQCAQQWPLDQKSAREQIQVCRRDRAGSARAPIARIHTRPTRRLQ